MYFASSQALSFQNVDFKIVLFVPSHGNMCAGVIAGVADNNVCGVGLAYNAKIAG